MDPARLESTGEGDTGKEDTGNKALQLYSPVNVPSVLPEGTSAALGFLLKIRQGCRNKTLSDGRIEVTADFDHRLIVDAEDLTLCDLYTKFGKFLIFQNEKYIPGYNDTNSRTFCDIRTDEAVAMMWGKHMGTRTVAHVYPHC